MPGDRAPEADDGAGADPADGAVLDHEETVLFVRPIGADADEPIARRIGDRELYVGNRHAASEATGGRFAHVLSLTAERQPATTHHCPLVDGPANEWRAFESAADAARRLHERDGSLLVHCAKGISRSAAVAAAALAVVEDRSVADAVAAVQTARPHAVPHPALHAQAVWYAAARR